MRKTTGYPIFTRLADCAVGELALVFLLVLSITPTPAQETHLSNNWSIVAVSEELGVFCFAAHRRGSPCRALPF